MYIAEKAMGEPSVQGFVDFVRGQPADRTYNYPDTEHCALGCYAQSIGKRYFDLPTNVLAVGNDMAAGTPWNFGALAKRPVSKLADLIDA